MPTQDPQTAISRLMGRYGGSRGAVPTPALLGLQDTLDGVGLHESGWA